MADVVVNGPSDPIGQGWSVGGTAQLFPDGQGGYFWVAGDGGIRDFQAGNGTTFVSPPNDFGTLVKNGNGTFTYTDPQQVKWNFTSSGPDCSPASSQPDGPTETFTYNGSGALTAVTEPGGWTATFTYDANSQLAGIVEPGGRVADVHARLVRRPAHGIACPTAAVRTFTYDSVGHMPSDSWGTQITTYTYDPTGPWSAPTTGRAARRVWSRRRFQGLQTSPADSRRARAWPSRPTPWAG